MKYLYLICLMLLFACNKDNDPMAVRYTPNLVSVGQAMGTYHFTFYDLNHADNKDKRYLRARLVGQNQFAIVEGPKPLDSMATGWPAEIRNISFASGEQHFNYHTDQYIRRVGNAFVLDSYSSLPLEPTWKNLMKRVNHSKLPNGHFMLTNEVYNFYFGGQAYYQKYPQHSGETADLRPIGDFCQACGILYDWSTVKNAVVLGDNPSLGRIYFFDFEKWMYWYVQDAVPETERVASTPSSLDNFIQWPEGWGKK